MASRVRVLALILSSLVLLAGLIYLYYVQVIFPHLVPGHGGGERFSLSEANDYTFQIPWDAYSRLHITLQANEIVELYINDEYTSSCTHYDLVIEPGDSAWILLKSHSPVSGKFTAWQEVPFEKQMFAYSIISTGLIAVVLSIKIKRKR